MFSELRICSISIGNLGLRDFTIFQLMKYMVISLRVDILPKRLTSNHRAHILHRRLDEIFLFKLMVEHLESTILLLVVRIIIDRIKISFPSSHFLYQRFQRTREFRSMVTDQIFEIGSMLRIIVMQFGRYSREQYRKASIMLVAIMNIPIWKSQKYSYNLSENLKISFHLFQIVQAMINGMQ